MSNVCNVKYSRHGTELTFQETVSPESNTGQSLITAGFHRSVYTVRNAITLEAESYIPYWYHSCAIDPGEISAIVGMPVTGDSDSIE